MTATPAVAFEAAKNSSDLYFYRNKSRILEQDLARVQARLHEALLATGAVPFSFAPPAQVAESAGVSMAALNSELLARESALLSRDTLIGSLQEELAKRDAMMRTLAFRVAWKYQRSPRILRLGIRAIALPFVLPYLGYRAVKMKFLAARGNR